jgi:hypothetical protein
MWDNLKREHAHWLKCRHVPESCKLIGITGVGILGDVTFAQISLYPSAAASLLGLRV